MKRAAKKSVKTTEKTTDQTTVPALIPQPHGGALRAGGTPGNVGGGRPTDEIRAKLRNLADEKALPFLADKMDGKLKVYLVGTCEKCKHEQGFDAETLEYLMKQLGTNDEQRIKISEMLLKHGLASKELVIANDNAASFFDCISRAAAELFGDAGADTLKARAVALMDRKA